MGATRIEWPVMGDLFHPDMPYVFIVQVLDAMGRSPQHTFLLLTKCPERMAEVMHDYTVLAPGNLPPNLWLGTSCSTQADIDHNVPCLLRCPAAARFLNLESLIENVNLYLAKYIHPVHCDEIGLPSGQDGDPWIDTGIDWVTVGAESGPPRPCSLDCIRSIRDQCVAAGVPLFIKRAEIDGKVVEMPSIDGKWWNQLPGDRPTP